MNTKTTIVPLIIFFSSLTFSCKKDTPNPAKDITGEWNWNFTQAVYPSDPLTPENTGVQERLVFSSNKTWTKTENGIKTGSGTYSLGHGSHTPYAGAHVYIYDSVVYYRDGVDVNAWDYYNVFNDTLQFCPGYAGKLASFNSFNFPNGFNGSKFWIKK
jgi:hypothetical protein